MLNRRANRKKVEIFSFLGILFQCSAIDWSKIYAGTAKENSRGLSCNLNEKNFESWSEFEFKIILFFFFCLCCFIRNTSKTYTVEGKFGLDFITSHKSHSYIPTVYFYFFLFLFFSFYFFDKHKNHAINRFLHCQSVHFLSVYI